MKREKKLLKEELLERLDNTLQKEGFKLSRSAGEFTKRKSDGWWKYQVIFLDRDYGWELNLGMLIRKNVVEEIFHEISGFGEQYKKGTPTIGITVENYLHDKNDRYRFDLQNDADIENIRRQLIGIFYDYAVPFFEKYDVIGEIEKAVNAMNVDVDNSSLTGPVFNGFKGIILAKLCNKENYRSLMRDYYEYYSNFSDGFYLPNFEKLIAYLDTLDTTSLI